MKNYNESVRTQGSFIRATNESFTWMQRTGSDRRVRRDAEQAAGVWAVIDDLLSSTARRPKGGWAYMRVADDTEININETMCRCVRGRT